MYNYAAEKKGQEKDCRRRKGQLIWNCLTAALNDGLLIFWKNDRLTVCLSLIAVTAEDDEVGKEQEEDGRKSYLEK